MCVLGLWNRPPERPREDLSKVVAHAGQNGTDDPYRPAAMGARRTEISVGGA
jgi:hypothetical protein